MKVFSEGLKLSKNTFEDLKKIKNSFRSSQTEFKNNSKKNSIYGLYLRAFCLSQTTIKCDNAMDFQSLAHAQRGLLEILTDLILLHHDDSDKSVTKMKDWEDSYKLKWAEKIINFYKPNPVPDRFEAQEEFVKFNKARINNIRKAYGWLNSKAKPVHPRERWTGSDLSSDIKKAEKFEPKIGLAEHFETEYTRINWFTHGSGLTGIRYFEESGFYLLCGITHDSCSRLVKECAKMAIKGLK